MRLLMFGMPFLALAAALAQGLRLMTVMAVIPAEPSPSQAAISRARAEISQMRARDTSASLAPSYVRAQDFTPARKLVLSRVDRP